MQVSNQALANQALMDAFGFEASDLAANRAGLLTERQRQTIAANRTMVRRSFTCAIVAIGVSVLGVGIGVVVGMQGDTSIKGPLWLIPAAILGLIVVLVAVLGWRPIKQLNTLNIQTCVGSAQKTTNVVKQQWTMYALSVGDTSFQLALEEQFNAFQMGKTYRIYYLDYAPTNMILSAEIVESV